jgi:hypothetical protein
MLAESSDPRTALKCRPVRTGRYTPPVNMVTLTQDREIAATRSAETGQDGGLAKQRATAAKVRPPHFCILEPERLPASRMESLGIGTIAREKCHARQANEVPARAHYGRSLSRRRRSRRRDPGRYGANYRLCMKGRLSWRLLGPLLAALITVNVQCDLTITVRKSILPSGHDGDAVLVGVRGPVSSPPSRTPPQLADNRHRAGLPSLAQKKRPQRAAAR